MPIPLSSEESQAVLDALARFPEGATVLEIRQSLSISVDGRTVQRWLSELRKDGRVVAGRSGREIRYILARFLPSSAVPTNPANEERAASGNPSPPGASADDFAAAASRSAQPPAPDRRREMASEPVPPPRVSLDVLVAAAVVEIVRAGVATPGWRAVLQGIALHNDVVGPAMVAFVDRVVALLTSLTAADAEQTYGLSAQQYAVWREHCALAELQPGDASEERTGGGDGADAGVGAVGSQAAGVKGGCGVVGPRTIQKVGDGDAVAPGGRTRGSGGAALVRGVGEAGYVKARVGGDEAVGESERRARDAERRADGDGGARTGGARVDGGIGAEGEAGAILNRGFGAVGQRTIRNVGDGDVAAPSGSATPETGADGGKDPATSRFPRLSPFNLHLSTATAAAAATLLLGFVQFVGQSPWLTGLLVLVGGGGALAYREVRRRVVAAEVRSRWLRRLAAGGVALFGSVSALVWHQHVRQRPSIDVVCDHVAQSLAPLPVRIAAIDVGYVQASSATCQVTYQAMVETTAPLYRRIDTNEYLRTHAADPWATAADVRTRAQELVLLATQTPVGTADSVAGLATAWRKDGGWVFTGEPVRLSGSRIVGEPRPDGAAVFVVDDAADAGRLRSWFEAHLASGVASHPSEGASGGNGGAVAMPTAPVAPTGSTGTAGPPTRPVGTSNGDVAVAGNGGADGVGRQGRLPLPKPADGGVAVRPAQGGVSDTMTLGRTNPDVPTRSIIPLIGSSNGSSVIAGNGGADGVGRQGRLPLPEPADGAAVRTPKDGVSEPAGPALPRYPRDAGAYALINGAWAPLPKNNARVLQTRTQAVSAKAIELMYADDPTSKLPGNEALLVVAAVAFDGREAVPCVPAGNVVIAYVGTLAPLTEEQLTRNPELRDYPVLEMAPTRTVEGDRRAPLSLIASGVLAFGINRVPATVTQPVAGVTVLRAAGPLARSGYAVACGPAMYEVRVE